MGKFFRFFKRKKKAKKLKADRTPFQIHDGLDRSHGFATKVSDVPKRLLHSDTTSPYWEMEQRRADLHQVELLIDDKHKHTSELDNDGDNSETGDHSLTARGLPGVPDTERYIFYDYFDHPSKNLAKFDKDRFKARASDLPFILTLPSFTSKYLGQHLENMRKAIEEKDPRPEKELTAKYKDRRTLFMPPSSRDIDTELQAAELLKKPLSPTPNSDITENNVIAPNDPVKDAIVSAPEFPASLSLTEYYSDIAQKTKQAISKLFFYLFKDSTNSTTQQNDENLQSKQKTKQSFKKKKCTKRKVLSSPSKEKEITVIHDQSRRDIRPSPPQDKAKRISREGKVKKQKDSEIYNCIHSQSNNQTVLRKVKVFSSKCHSEKCDCCDKESVPLTKTNGRQVTISCPNDGDPVEIRVNITCLSHT